MRLVVAFCIALFLLALPAPATAQTAAEARALNEQALALYRQGKYAEAEPLFRRLLATLEKALDPEHPDVAKTLIGLGAVFRAQGRYAEAEPLHRRALATLEKALGPEHPDVATGLGHLAALYVLQGRYAEAEPLHRRLLATLEKALGPEHPSVATGLNNLAGLFHAQGRYAEAEPLHKRALAIREKALGPEHPDVATSLNNLALLFRAQGRYAEAEPLYRRALAILERALGPEHPPHVAASLGGLAGLFRAQGRYAEAEPLFKRALAINEKALGPEHPHVAVSLGSLAELFREQGRYAEAEPLYRRALAINEKALGPEHPDVATDLNNLALLFRAQGRYAEAEPLHRRALAISEKALGSEHPNVAASLGNLAELFRAQGRYAEAEPLYRRSLAIREKALGPEHPHVAASLNNLALLFEAQGRYAEAEPLFRRALAISEKALDPEHPDVAKTLIGLGAVFRAQGRYAEAEPLHRSALAIYEKALGPEHPDVATSLGHIAVLQFHQNRTTEALASIRRATAIHRLRGERGEQRRDEGAASERRSVEGFFAWHVAIAHAASRVLPAPDKALNTEAFEAAQWARAGEVGGSIARMAARFAAGSDRLARVARERQDALERRRALDKALIATASKPQAQRSAEGEAKLRAEIAVLDQRLDELDAALARDFPQYAEVAAAKALPVAEAQAQLAADEALVAYLVLGEETFLWVARRDRIAWERLAIGRKALDQAVKTLRATLDPAENREFRPVPVAAAHQLYRDILAVAEPVLAGARHLIVVPDGPLQSLPFGVLVTEEPRAGVSEYQDYRRLAWLGRRYAITTLPAVSSLRALRAFARAAKPREPFAGFGDPELTGRPGDRRALQVARLYRGFVADAAVVRQLEPLPESADELRALAKSLKAKADTVWLRREATETNAKAKDLARYRVLAFATHGLMAGDFREFGEPALVLTPPNIGTEQDDGLLAASEIAQLKLDADWVILSACNTAAPDGTPGAEGLSGLAKAFFYAGARSLLVSHWPVVSGAAVRLTTGAVEALEREPGIGRAEALRRSMLALLDDPKAPPHYAHPAVWAPFSLVGEGGAGR